MANTHFSGPLWVNGVQITAGTTSAVAYAQLQDAVSGNNPVLAAKSTSTNVSLQLSGQGTGLALVGSSNTATIAAGACTINAQRGTITYGGISITANGTASITLVNNKISTSSQILMQVQALTGTNSHVGGIPVLTHYRLVDSGSCVITLANASGTTLSGTVNIAFLVLS